MKNCLLFMILVTSAFCLKAQQVERMNADSFKKNIWNYDTASQWEYLGNKPTIVDLFASWCGACSQLSPVLDRLQTYYGDQIQIYKVDVDEETELAELFQVQSVPMLVFFPINNTPFVITGAYPFEDLKQLINDGFNIPSVNQSKTAKK